MNLTSAINYKLLLMCFLFSVSALNAQDFDELTEEEQDSIRANTTEKSAIFTANFYRPIPSNSTSIGRGTDGKIGFALEANIFLYKKFLLGISYGISFLDVTDTEFTGGYERSRIINASLNIGYEFRLNRKWDLGLVFTPVGVAEYRNYVGEGRLSQQYDTALYTRYETYISYNFAGNFSLFINYSFRNDRTRIDTAPEIQNDFDNIKYHNIGLGLKFALGRRAMF